MNNILEHNGYHAKVEFSADDNCFVGHVLGITDTLAFDGQSAEEIVQSFHACIENYLDMCREIGKFPDKELSEGIF